MAGRIAGTAAALPGRRSAHRVFEPSAWRARYAPQEATEERLERAYNHFLARQQQFAAVLEAHGIPVLFAHCGNGEDARRLLSS